VGRQSRATLQTATVALQDELEARINEGLFARVRRYFSDQELRKRLVLARGARQVVETLKRNED